MNKNLPPLQPQEPRKSLVLPPSVSISYQLQTAAIKQNGSSRTDCDRSFTITGEICSPKEPYQLETLVTDDISRRREGPVVIWSFLEVSATNSVCVITRRESGDENTQQALQIPLKDGAFNYSHVSFNKPRSETDGSVHPVDFFVRFRVLCWLFNNRMVSFELGREGPFRVYHDTECQPSVTAPDLKSQDQMNTELLPDRPGVTQKSDSLSAPSLNRFASMPVYSNEDPFRYSSGFIDPSQLFMRGPSRDVVGASERYNTTRKGLAVIVVALYEGMGLGAGEHMGKTVTYAPSRLADAPSGIWSTSRDKPAPSDDIITTCSVAVI